MVKKAIKKLLSINFLWKIFEVLVWIVIVLFAAEFIMTLLSSLLMRTVFCSMDFHSYFSGLFCEKRFSLSLFTEFFVLIALWYVKKTKPKIIGEHKAYKIEAAATIIIISIIVLVVFLTGLIPLIISKSFYSLSTLLLTRFHVISVSECIQSLSSKELVDEALGINATERALEQINLGIVQTHLTSFEICVLAKGS